MKIFFLQLILMITAALPLKAIHWLGHLVGKLTWLTNSRIRRIAEKNIQLCFPELNAQQQTELVKKILNETGKVILEAGKVWQLKPEKMLALVTESENEHLIKQAQDAGRGVIIAAPHYGSWEMVGLYCAKQHTMTSMYAPQGDAQIDAIMRQARQRTGAKLIPTDITGIRAMSKALKQHELVGILPDQSPNDNGLFIPFFNQPCYTMTLLPKLAKKNNAVVLFTYAKRLENSRGFKMVFRAAGADIAKLEPEQAAIQMNLDVEKLIRETPHQYQWTYKRFKKQPEGSASVY
ncbi:Lipid A biosynthesis lauroyl acyltransferase [hydrothermal vent metagenome]|uniref:Lipid A biosynthesis lauroyl acyltransferase n=1 Tax=hydrothermal vent metagenome TaxID=652676 RepID=A0A3B0X322_9ZZZZ